MRFHFECFHDEYIFLWNWPNATKILPALWLLMAWCFNTRAAVAMLLITHLCISSHIWVNMHVFALMIIIAGSFKRKWLDEWSMISAPNCVKVCSCAPHTDNVTVNVCQLSNVTQHMIFYISWGCLYQSNASCLLWHITCFRLLNSLLGFSKT